jgi:hypothetical protein
MANGGIVMSEQQTQEAKATNRSQPYSPSWVDRLTELIDRLPGSSGVYYLGLWLILILLQILTLWIDIGDPFEGFYPVQAFIPGTIAFMLAFIGYFRKRAKAALEAMRSVLKTEEDQFRDFEYRLTNLPMRETILASLGMLLVLYLIDVVGEPFWLETRDIAPITTWLFRLIWIGSWWMWGVLVYHTVHNLRLVNKIYTEFTQINLFRTNPLHGLSNLMALSAISLTVLPIGFFASVQLTNLAALDPVVIGLVVGVQLIAAFAFIWPQWGIHRLLKAEKDHYLDEARQDYEKVLREIHRRVEEGEMESVANLSGTLSTIDAEIKSLNKIRDWPWDPETVRWLITALVLPIGFMLLQMVLQRLMG